MKRKPVIIAVEDNEGWLQRICKILADYFDTDLERFSSFDEAKERIIRNPEDFDLLVTDIYPTPESKEMTGLTLANFVHETKPVIIITGDSRLAQMILKEYNFNGVFDKGLFEKSDFISSVGKSIDPAIKGVTNSFDTRPADNLDINTVSSPDVIDGTLSALQVLNPEPDLISPDPEEKKFEVEVFYATDRDKTNIDGRLSYGNNRSDIKYGICQVNIPGKKKFGKVPRPSGWRLEFKENADKHIVITSINQFGFRDFFYNLSNKIELADQNDAFVFIHGFNVTFDDAIYRAAQMAFDLGFTGAPIVYSWPSRAKVSGYIADLNNVEYSLNNIIKFLKDVKAQTKVKKIHLIAHSMGNRAMTNALIELSQQNFYDGFIFNQIILAAPDIDAEVFTNNIAPKLANCSKRITLYVSSKDTALKTSSMLSHSVIRAGEIRNKVICLDGIDTIDASKVHADLMGHGYFAKSGYLINDIFMLINLDLQPSKRNLQQHNLGEKVYWSFK